MALLQAPNHRIAVLEVGPDPVQELELIALAWDRAAPEEAPGVLDHRGVVGRQVEGRPAGDEPVAYLRVAVVDLGAALVRRLLGSRYAPFITLTIDPGPPIRWASAMVCAGPPGGRSRRSDGGRAPRGRRRASPARTSGPPCRSSPASVRRTRSPPGGPARGSPPPAREGVEPELGELDGDVDVEVRSPSRRRLRART